MDKNKTIGILSTFYNMDNGYSLTSVVRDQLNYLVKNGYKTIFCVLPSFKDDALVPNGVEIRKIVPQLILEPYKGTSYPSHWKEDVKKAKDLFEKNLQDIDYLICHDIFFIDTFLPYNIALRESNLNCQFLAWTHSAPSTRPVLTDNPHANRYTLPPRTKLVYLNHDKANDLAEMYGAWLKDVRVVHNARDPRTFWDLDPLVNRMIDKTRNWAAEMKIYADELIFTSQEGKEYELGVKSKIVSDFFRISNIFIFPTISENSSLVLLEAMLSGNLLVLNKKVGTLLEHAGESAIYFDFDYKEPKEANENYYLDLAKIIASQFEVQKPLQVKRRALQKNNYDYIFSHELENLFYE